MKKLGIVTTSRADWSLLRPLVLAAQNSPAFDLRLYVTGTHLCADHGNTVQEIERDGFVISARLDTFTGADKPADIARNMSATTRAFADEFEKEKPDLLVVLGDRYEMFAAALAAVPFNICLVHIHGGESTEGLIDEALRHSLTKLSHLHLVSHARYAQRVVQLGEEPWRVTVCGAPGLSNLKRMDLMNDAELESITGLLPGQKPLVVTFHPETLNLDEIEIQCRHFYEALEAFDLPMVVTQPNMDTLGLIASSEAKAFVSRKPDRHFVSTLGSRGYFSLLQRALAMVGNSSSGILEAASFALPVVNVGDRQRGRIHGPNVLHCPARTQDIQQALSRALSPEFRKSLTGLKNPYDQGDAVEIILKVLRETPLDRTLLLKKFHDLPA